MDQTYVCSGCEGGGLPFEPRDSARKGQQKQATVKAEKPVKTKAKKKTSKTRVKDKK